MGSDLQTEGLARLEAAGLEIDVVTTIVDHDERWVGEVRLTDGRRFAVKIGVDTEKADRERLGLLAAASVDLPVPEIVFDHPGSPDVLVLSWVPGVTLRSRNDDAWTTVGAGLARLHRVPPPADLTRWFEAEGWADALRQWSAAGLDGRAELGFSTTELATLQHLVDRGFELAAGASESLIHGDSQDAHWYVDPADSTCLTGVIDFGDTALGDPALDIVVLTLFAPARLPAVLDGYDPDAAFRAHLDRVGPPYRALVHLAAVHWLAAKGYPVSVRADHVERTRAIIARWSVSSSS